MEAQTETRILGRLKQAQTIQGAGNPHWRGGQITKQCVRCGSEFKVYPSTTNRTHCSHVCGMRDANRHKGIPNKKRGRTGIFNALYRKGYMLRGELNSNYKGDNTISKRHALIRVSQDFQDWRQKVFERDNWTCQECGQRGGELNAHHVKSFAQYPELRFDIDNGKTLCVKCHRKTFIASLAYRTS